jgi:CBS domain-containing protein
LTQLDRPVAHDKVERSLMEDPVHVLKPRPPVTIRATSSARAAIDGMLKHDVGALLVVDADGKLEGILSERDLMTKLAGLHEIYERVPVERIMTPAPEIVSLNDTLAYAVNKMDAGGYRHLPVVQDDRPVGVISVRDLLRHITQLCRDS